MRSSKLHNIVCDIVCVAGIAIVLVSGCGEQSRPESTEPVVGLPNRLEIVSRSVRHKYNYSRATVLRDNVTGQEFLWVGNSNSTHIISIGYDLEYINKLNEENDE